MAKAKNTQTKKIYRFDEDGKMFPVPAIKRVIRNQREENGKLVGDAQVDGTFTKVEFWKKSMRGEEMWKFVSVVRYEAV